MGNCTLVGDLDRRCLKFVDILLFSENLLEELFFFEYFCTLFKRATINSIPLLNFTIDNS